MCNCFSKNLGLGEAAKRTVGTGTNQLPDMSAYSGAYNSTGWRKTPDGYIEQWGTVVPTAANVQQQFSFPIPFTNSCVSLQLTSFNNSTTIVSAQGFIIDKTKFSALVSAANNAIYFRALGK